MKTTPFKAKLKQAYNKPLHELDRKNKETGEVLERFPKGKTIHYTGDYQAITSEEEAKAEKEWPDDVSSFVLAGINARLLAAAKQKRMLEIQNENHLVKPEMETDIAMQLRAMMVPLRASKRYTEEEARQRAAENLGLEEWPDWLD